MHPKHHSFFELILKYYVTTAHPLLIYKEPFAPKINDSSKTIGLHEAINFLNNEGNKLPKGFKEDLEWLKKLRNNIEHHKFTMNTEEVEKTIGRLMSAIHDFDESHENIDLGAFLSSDQYDLFHELAQTYKKRVSSVEIVLDDVPEYMSGILRCCSIISMNGLGEEIKDHQDLIDNSEYFSIEDLIEDVARMLDIDPEIIEIVD